MKKIQFSKIVLGAAIILWIISAALGWWYVFTRDAGLLELLTYIGSPVAVAYGFYSWKAKAENVIQIAKGIEKDAEKDSKKGKKTTPEAKAKLVKVVAEVLNKIETEDLDNGN